MEYAIKDGKENLVVVGSIDSYIASMLPQTTHIPDEKERMAHIIDVFSHVDTSDIIKKKKRSESTSLSYLSWAKMWEVVLQHFPDAKNDILIFDDKPYWDLEPIGYFVVTYIIIDGVCRYMWLPVMDANNETVHAQSTTVPIKSSYNNNAPKEKTIPAINAVLVNKALMRCLVKNAAMFGLGLNLYNGEDLPEVIRKEREHDAAEERKLKVMIDRVTKLGKVKFAKNKTAVQEIMMRHNNGSTNPADIQDIETCEKIIDELNKIDSME